MTPKSPVVPERPAFLVQGQQDQTLSQEGDVSQAEGRVPSRSGSGEGDDLDGTSFNWRDFALCREVDTNLFFPEPCESSETAKSICARCEVRTDCLKYALERHEPYGIYGGLTGKERRQIRRRVA